MSFSSSDVEVSMERSERWYAECEMNINAGAYNSAIASAYNAMFHAARTVLYALGYREKSHYCVARFLDSLVEKGLLEEKWVNMLDRARNVRHADQYNIDFVSTKEDAEAMMEMANSFIERMKELVKEIRRIEINGK